MLVTLLILTLLLTTTGQLLQKEAANRSYQGRLLLVAIGFLGLGALCWLAVLQKLPVGMAYSMLSLNYVLVIFASRWIFHEKFNICQWLGVACVVSGVIILGV